MNRWLNGLYTLLLGSTTVLLGCVAEVESAEPGETAEENVGEVLQAEVPPSWQKRQNICQTLSFYGVNPAYNPGVLADHLLGTYKRLYYTTGQIVSGWVPVYSAGQEYWHTGWVRQECLVNGWPYPQSGSVIY